MEKEHYILKYTHPYLLCNRTCRKYFVISNAAIDSLPAPWTFRLESAQLQTSAFRQPGLECLENCIIG